VEGEPLIVVRRKGGVPRVSTTPIPFYTGLDSVGGCKFQWVELGKEIDTRSAPRYPRASPTPLQSRLRPRFAWTAAHSPPRPTPAAQLRPRVLPCQVWNTQGSPIEAERKVLLRSRPKCPHKPENKSKACAWPNRTVSWNLGEPLNSWICSHPRQFHLRGDVAKRGPIGARGDTLEDFDRFRGVSIVLVPVANAVAVDGQVQFARAFGLEQILRSTSSPAVTRHSGESRNPIPFASGLPRVRE